jgi:hypothetical protein
VFTRTAVVLAGAAVAVLFFLTLAPARLVLPATWSDGTIPGVIHVHTTRSDGRSGPDEVAAAAARAGLKFLVFTDHGDATRTPDPPMYRSGVLCLDGVEISTTGGHYVAIAMPASPYPLGGEPRDVVEDVRRLNGFGIVAHPDSPKTELHWREWGAPFDGIETLNPDTSWRQRFQTGEWRPKARLLEALAGYPLRPAETIAALLLRSDVLEQWSRIAGRRRLVMIAGTDAHAKVALRGSDPSPFSLPIPGYEVAFRTISVHVRPERTLSGDASADAAVLVRALRAGHLYSVIDGVASPPAFELTATNASGAAREGDDLPAGGPVTLSVRSNAPPEFATVIFNGVNLVSSNHHEQRFDVRLPETPGVYRVEIRSARTEHAPWLMSNPIYVRGSEPPADDPAHPPATEQQSLFDGKTAGGWRVEHAVTSVGSVDVTPDPGGGGELRLRYALAGGPLSGQYAGLVYDTPNGTGPNDRVAFRVRAEHPMRISVQLRADVTARAGERWQRSVYVDAAEQEHVVYFDDLTPAGPTSTLLPPLRAVRSILFVVDTTNTRPGSSGYLWIKRLTLEH